MNNFYLTNLEDFAALGASRVFKSNLLRRKTEKNSKFISIITNSWLNTAAVPPLFHIFCVLVSTNDSCISLFWDPRSSNRISPSLGSTIPIAARASAIMNAVPQIKTTSLLAVDSWRAAATVSLTPASRGEIYGSTIASINCRNSSFLVALG